MLYKTWIDIKRLKKKKKAQLLSSPNSCRHYLYTIYLYLGPHTLGPTPCNGTSTEITVTPFLHLLYKQAFPSISQPQQALSLCY